GIATLGGPLEIPPLFYNGPIFFVAYQWTGNGDAAADSGLVPNAAQRSGDLSGLLNASGQPLTIYDPATGQPFTGPIPVSPQAQALLALYPLPNLPGNGRYNYQTEVLNETHIDALQSRLSKSIGHRDQLDGGFAFENSLEDTSNFFHFRDATDVLGLDAHINWSHQFGDQILGVFGFHFTRLRTKINPQFDGVTNISGNAGITGNAQDPQDWGPPALIFSSGIAGLTDGNSEFNRNRTDAISFKGTWTHLRHTVQFGGNFRRQEFNQFTQLNPRGSFAFTGAATQAPATAGAAPGATGSDLADFLLGTPDTSTLADGNPSEYFRTSVYDAYINDKFRMLSSLTVNAGLRWELGAPITELFGHMVNLDIAPGFTAAAPVLASSPVGPVTGSKYPSSLVRPTYSGWEPRLGIS
ncbi:MAG: TonB-dependent receptor, partial [Terriglobia bacterium]